MAQVLLAIILSFLFYYYHKNYNRSFLKWWSISWASYAVLYISTALIFVLPSENADFASFMAIFGTYIQLLFLILGLKEYVKQKQVNRKQLAIYGLVILVFSLITYAIAAGDPSGSNLRYVLRVGLRSNIVGLSFLWMVYKILASKAFDKSLSKTFMLAAFTLYSLQQLWHSSIVYLNASGYSVPFPLSSYGIIDLFSMSLIGISMVMWLLENEHNSLTRTNRELDSFLYSTSHDLRAPIASTLGLTNLGKIESKEATSKLYFEKIETQLKKLDAIFGDILNYSKATKGALNMTELSFQDIVKDIYEQAKLTNENLPELIIEESAEQYFWSDRFLIESILSNLINNAVKYADYNKDTNYVKLELSRNSKTVEIRVEDNGIGMNELVLPKIFGMFYRASGKNEGSGLGLYIASQAAERLNAALTVSSKENIGSSFTLTFEEVKG